MGKILRIRQHDGYDCGAACLCSVAAWYGINISLSEARRVCGCTPEGTTIMGILEGAEELGLQGKALKAPLPIDKEQILVLKKPEAPVIVHTLAPDGGMHFMLVTGIKGDTVRVMDPSVGNIRKIDIEEFGRIWTGYVIMFVPGATFAKREERENRYIKLFKILKFHKKEIALALAGSMVLTIIGVCNSVFLKQLIDKAIPTGNITLLLVLSLLIVTLVPVGLFIDYARGIYLLRNDVRIDTRLVLGFLRKLFALPLSFLKDYSSGDLESRISDSYKIRAFISEGLVSIFIGVFTLLTVLLLMFTFYRRLALYTLLCVPLYILLYSIANHYNKKNSKVLAVAGARFEEDVIDSIEGAEAVRHFCTDGQSASRIMRWEDSFVNVNCKRYRVGRMNAVFGVLGSGISQLLLAIILVAGSFAAAAARISIGDLVSFYTLSAFFIAPMNSIVGINTLMNEALTAHERLSDVTCANAEKEARPAAAAGRIFDGRQHNGDIVIDRLTFRYRGRDELFSEFCCRIAQGKITAICGANGCGKSTLGTLLMRDLSPSKGTIAIGDTEINYYDIKSWRDNVTYVCQRGHLFNRSILDNITVGKNEVDMARLSHICNSLGLNKMLQSLPEGLLTVIGQKGRSLSGGEMQKILIARALYRDSLIYIFDECMNFMDAPSLERLVQVFCELRSKGKTVIIITHSEQFKSIADQTITI